MYLLCAIFLSMQVSYVVQESIILTICDMNLFSLHLLMFHLFHGMLVMVVMMVMV